MEEMWSKCDTYAFTLFLTALLASNIACLKGESNSTIIFLSKSTQQQQRNIQNDLHRIRPSSKIMAENNSKSGLQNVLKSRNQNSRESRTIFLLRNENNVYEKPLNGVQLRRNITMFHANNRMKNAASFRGNVMPHVNVTTSKPACLECGKFNKSGDKWIAVTKANPWMDRREDSQSGKSPIRSTIERLISIWESIISTNPKDDILINSHRAAWKPYDFNKEKQGLDKSRSHDDPSSSANSVDWKSPANSSGKLSSKNPGEWTRILFGPKGILTAIFQTMRSGATNSPHQNQQNSENDHPEIDAAFLPDFLTDPKPIDFEKLLNAFMKAPQDGFDPLYELPEFMGICNRLSCGDIYKAIDEFRKSELFTNFQMILQLIQDPKGLDVIGSFLFNPELIEQITDGNILESFLGSDLLGSVTSNKKRKKPEAVVKTNDGDFGTDFSSTIDRFNKERKPTAEELPEIAENIDSEDYYDTVEETIVNPDKVEPEWKTVNTLGPLKVPDISENIDEAPEIIDVDEVIDAFNIISNGKLRKVSSSTLPAPNQTFMTKNFREESDYYSMYYDDTD